MKKFMSLAIAVVLVVALIPMGVFDFSTKAATSGYYTYEIEDNRAIITKVDKAISGHVPVPRTLGGRLVGKIGDDAFKGCTNIVSVTVAQEIESIGARAFQNCSNLETVILYDVVTDVGAYAFTGTKFYNTSSNWQNGHLYSGTFLLAARDGTGTSVVRDGTTVIARQAFANTSYSEVILPESIKHIGDYAFYQSNLKKIVVPKGTESIGISAFKECYLIKSMTLPFLGQYADGSGYTNFASIFGYASYASHDEFVLSSLRNIVVTGGVIEDNAFRDCKYVKSITVSGDVKSIGKNAFYDCTALKDLTIGKAVKKIDTNAVTGCVSLENIWYEGSKEAAALISGAPKSATWHYNACPMGEDHLYDNACDTTCGDCGYTRTVSHSYEWVTDSENNCGVVGTKHEECSVCHAKANEGTEIEASGNHTYDNSCDTECNVCGFKRDIKHTNQIIITKATEFDDGGKQTECLVCSKKSNVVYYKASNVSLKKSSVTYNGKVQKPTVIVKDSKGNTISSSNYTVTYPSGMKNAGKYSVKVTFKGNYSGSKTLTYTINPIKSSTCSSKLSSTSYTYNGKAKTPSVTVKNAGGTTLKKGTHYTVTYASGRKNVGKYKVTIKFKGNYGGTETLYFTINPAKTSIKSVSGSAKSLKVSVNKKTTQVTGYEIQYSTSKKFTSAKTKTITSAKTTSATIKSLKAKKTYYVRVRTYKTVSGKKYYSGWSAYKSAKTK